MGLFDFFKKEKKTNEIKKNNSQECDITKTGILHSLFEIDKQLRDKNWETKFFENVKTASFTCGSPQVSIGPDGFPYFSLFLPEPNIPFESFCIMNLTGHLIEKGWGVVINPKNNDAEWVFSNGDILNLFLNNKFYSENNINQKKIETIKEGEEILIAQPSEVYLPTQTRVIIKELLIKYGIKTPKMMMIVRPANNGVIQELVFNVFPEDFSSEEMQSIHMAISWLLPRHYSILSLSKNANFNDGLIKI